MCNKFRLQNGKIDFSIDFSAMNYSEKDLEILKDKFTAAHGEMLKIESGAIKNPDENRKVTHFIDRILYPKDQLFEQVQQFAEDVRTGKIKGSTGKKFEYAVINGIGGSALGPQLMQFAINGQYWNELPAGKRRNFPRIYFIDNTDPAGVHDVSSVIELEKTLIVNISKSGGTQETQNNILAFEKLYKDAGLDFSKHSCAITMEDSHLDKAAKSAKWLKIFPMAESIGGRTSETSIVGHLPAALAGIDFRSFLKGACEMDEWTREPDYRKNPAYYLAAMWYLAGNGKGNKNMVIVPYSDRLILFSRYLQQLVMESIGKEKDLDGKIVYQGLNVFGNKGGTDAHAYIQQLNDGRNDFFATFIEVMKDAAEYQISGDIMMSDYLHGFQVGLINALKAKNRQLLMIQVKEVSPYVLGQLIALYERAVAVYAELVHINAFHQPGVQAYKLASKDIIKLTSDIQAKLVSIGSWKGTACEFCEKAGFKGKEFETSGILAKFAENSSARSFGGASISRVWDSKLGNWIYTVTQK